VPAGTTLVRELLAHLRAGRIAVPPAGSAARTTAPPSAPAPETAEEDWPNAKLVFKPGDGKIEASQQSGTRRTARVPLAEAVKQGAILPEVEMQLRGRKKVATATVRVRIQGGLVELIPLAKR
jgi:hypothetical protein